MDDYDARDQSDMDWEYGYDVGYAAGVEEGMEYEDELRAELTEMYDAMMQIIGIVLRKQEEARDSISKHGKKWGGK